jgi:hypothetical protein
VPTTMPQAHEEAFIQSNAKKHRRQLTSEEAAVIDKVLFILRADRSDCVARWDFTPEEVKEIFLTNLDIYCLGVRRALGELPKAQMVEEETGATDCRHPGDH